MSMQWFREGGWGMWPTLVFGLFMVAVSLRYAMRPERRLLPLLVSSGLLTLVAGALGFTRGLIMTSTHMGEVADKSIWLIGFGESLQDVGLALALLACGLLAILLGALRIARAPEPDRA
jgi:hypothetical protein